MNSRPMVSRFAGKRGMDLADASLYWLGVDTGILNVLTIGVADFGRYPLPDGRGFSLVLA